MLTGPACNAARRLSGPGKLDGQWARLGCAMNRARIVGPGRPSQLRPSAAAGSGHRHPAIRACQLSAALTSNVSIPTTPGPAADPGQHTAARPGLAGRAQPGPSGGTRARDLAARPELKRILEGPKALARYQIRKNREDHSTDLIPNKLQATPQPLDPCLLSRSKAQSR